MSTKMEKFVLFGDSITQQSASQEKGFAWTPALQDGKSCLEFGVLDWYGD
jgi:hypothetical protein